MDRPSSARPLPVPSRRLSRLGRLGAMTAGIAGNMAAGGIAELGRSRRPSMRNLLLTPRNVTRVADQLAQMRGAAMKIGQLISMDTGEVLPPELAQIMARLRDDAHFMPPAQLKQVLNAGWHPGWLKDFARFDVHPIAAASIGQVHRAQTKDGRDLAIKVQYPGVAESIDSDVANVGALIRMSGLLPKGFELAPYLDDARAQLRDETDYTREGAFMARFADMLRDDARFVVPERQDDLTTPQILAMTHIDGTPIEAAVSLPQDDRNRIAENLIDLTLRELFDFGLMQTDPNFANYLYQPDTGRIVLLDFGAAHQIAPATQDRYRRMMRAGVAGDSAEIDAAMAALGFVSEGTRPAHRAQIVRMVGTVFDALRGADTYDFTDMTLSNQMQRDGLALAEDGFVPPPVPMDVLLLQRKFGGMFLLAHRLGARVDVMALLRRYLR